MEIRHRGWSGFGGIAVWVRVWRDSCVGRCLTVAIVVVPSVECGWCLLWPWWVCFWVLVLCLFRRLGRGQAGRGLMGWQDFWSFSHGPSCLLFYFVYGYYSNLPFLSNSIFWGKKFIKKKGGGKALALALISIWLLKKVVFNHLSIYSI